MIEPVLHSLHIPGMRNSGGPSKSFVMLTGLVGALSRRPIAALVIAAAIPILLLAGWAFYDSSARTRAAAQAAATETVDFVMSRIAGELSAQVQVAESLALLQELDEPDLPSFYTVAERIIGARPLWHTIELDDPSGQQVLNLLRPLGAPLGPTADRDSFEEVMRTGRPTVGGIGPIGVISGHRLVPVRVPVMRDGAMSYVLTILLAPKAVSQILSDAGAPQNWIGAVLDGNGDIIARTVDENVAQALPASDDARAAINQAPEGFYKGRTLEGIASDVIYRAIPGTQGWTVHFGIPSEFLDRPVRNALFLLGGGILASLTLAAVLATLVARDLAERRREQQALAEAALAVSEERRAIAIEAAELGAWWWNPFDGVVAGSSRFQALLNLRSGAGEVAPPQWPATHVICAVHPEDRAPLARAIVDARERRKPVNLEVRAMGPRSEPRWVRITGRASATGSHEIHGVIADVHDAKTAEIERRKLLRRMAEAQEEVQRRISRELHDQVGQTVTGLSLGLKSLENAVSDEDCEQVRWLRNLTNQIGRDIHRAAADLRPTSLDDLGLFRALAADGSEWSRRHGIALDIQVVGGEARLPSEIETVIYRVIQEALTNVLKHAAATAVSIVLERRGAQLNIVIEDDGAGFDPEATRPEPGPCRSGSASPASARLGLSGIRERLELVGGSFAIESSAGAGATLFVNIPLPEEVRA